jgi:hypothetical protein
MFVIVYNQMLFSIKLDLSPQQLISLKNAMSKGSDFKAKLGAQQLMAGNFSVDVNKALYNKVIKHHAQGVGMIITLPSSILSKLAKTMDITVPKDISLIGAGTPKRSPKRTPRSVHGGAITAAAAIASLGMVNEFLNDYPQVKNFLGSIAEDVAYLLSNPMAISYKFIVAVKIPNMNKRYRDIVISIDRLKKIIPSLAKPAVKRNERRIINLETLRDRVGNHIQTLIERLPIIKEMAEERNETLKQRQAKQLESQIEKTENKLESLTEKKGEGLQVMHYGNGLQVDPAPYYGNGLVMDKIKGRIKKEITPMIDNEKEKMKKQMEKQMEIAKKKAEAEVKKKFNAEISKQKSKLQDMAPIDISQLTGGCMRCTCKKKQ